MEVTASAPGKVFLAGEYAVTRGGPAVAAAVTRRVSCRARRTPGAGVLTLRSTAHACRLRLADAEASEAPAELRFVAAAALVSARHLSLRDVDVEIESAGDLDDGEVKTGLGGSAAITAATVAAMHALAGRDAAAPSTLERRLVAGVLAHRLAQRGGSAADVVVSTVGGLIHTAGLDARECPASVADCAARLRSAPPIDFSRLELPRGLAIAVAATARPARSGPRASRFVARLGEDARLDPVLAAWMAGMRCATEELAAACRAGSIGRALAALEAAGRLLARLGAIAGIPILTRELRAACAAARRVAAAAKPSGAGGGDCAIALVEASRHAALREAWSACGVRPLDVALSPEGVRVTPAMEGAHV